VKRTYSLDAPDQQRLKVARTEIEAILKKHDLAGAVVLHTPGMTEFFYDVQPSYSCAWIDDAQQRVRVKSLAADYGGDTAAQQHDQAATANLFHGLASDLSGAAMMFREVATFVDRATRAWHTAGQHVADPADGRRQ
jgi:hypothetical protein